MEVISMNNKKITLILLSSILCAPTANSLAGGGISKSIKQQQENEQRMREIVQQEIARQAAQQEAADSLADSCTMANLEEAPQADSQASPSIMHKLKENAISVVSGSGLFLKNNVGPFLKDGFWHPMQNKGKAVSCYGALLGGGTIAAIYYRKKLAEAGTKACKKIQDTAKNHPYLAKGAAGVGTVGAIGTGIYYFGNAIGLKSAWQNHPYLTVGGAVSTAVATYVASKIYNRSFKPVKEQNTQESSTKQEETQKSPTSEESKQKETPKKRSWFSRGPSIEEQIAEIKKENEAFIEALKKETEEEKTALGGYYARLALELKKETQSSKDQQAAETASLRLELEKQLQQLQKTSQDAIAQAKANATSKIAEVTRQAEAKRKTAEEAARQAEGQRLANKARLKAELAKKEAEWQDRYGQYRPQYLKAALKGNGGVHSLHNEIQSLKQQINNA